MRNSEIIGKFGEIFTASLFYDLGYTVDMIDAQGIDLICYKDDKRYGVSVKSRNIQFGENKSINLTYNDITYTNDESKIRGAEPAYAFVVSNLSRIDVLVVTQTYVFENMFSSYDNVYNIDDYKGMYTNKKDSGATKSISIAPASKNNWKNLLGESGVIFTNCYQGEQVNDNN